MNDAIQAIQAIQAQKFLELRERMRIANHKYKATDKGKAKSAENQRHYYKIHSNDEGFLEKRRDTANAFYATNEAYRKQRQEKARQRYYSQKYGPESDTTKPESKSI